MNGIIDGNAKVGQAKVYKTAKEMKADTKKKYYFHFDDDDVVEYDFTDREFVFFCTNSVDISRIKGINY